MVLDRGTPEVNMTMAASTVTYVPVPVSEATQIDAQFPIGSGNTLEILAAPFLVGEYVSVQTNNVATVAYTVNGEVVTLPFSLAEGDTLAETITRTDAAKGAYVLLSQTAN